jgi:hypothetical protein
MRMMKIHLRRTLILSWNWSHHHQIRLHPMRILHLMQKRQTGIVFLLL